jgi:hypothetical protein
VNTRSQMIRLLLSLIVMNSGVEVAAENRATTTMARRLGCHDYSILNNPSDKAKFEKHCGSNSEADRLALLTVLNRLNPVNEASAAAKRGDFRLAALIGGGVPAPGQHRFWSVEGIDCDILEDIDVAMWLGMSDVFENPTHGRLQGSMRRFAASYNAALLAQHGFPIERGCKLWKR